MSDYERFFGSPERVALTVTTGGTWSGGRITNPKCYGCFHSCVMYGRLVCCCASRTVEHGVNGDTCKSYLGRKVDE